MRKARDVSYRRKFDLKQVEKAQNNSLYPYFQ